MSQGILSREALAQEVQKLWDLMVSVSTGEGPALKDAQKDYADRWKLIRKTLDAMGLRDPNPYKDIWLWHGRWTRGDLPKYRDRRMFLTVMFSPLIDQLEAANSGDRTGFGAEPTGWERVDRCVEKARVCLGTARVEEDFQQVGLYCREVLISVAQAVHDPQRHPPLDDTTPSQTDAKRMLEAFIAVELGGGSNEITRKHAKAALDLAVSLQHDRHASFRTAAMCEEATTSVLNLVAILSGRRDPAVEAEALNTPPSAPDPEWF
jgi:hypothetical protein